MPGWKGYTPNPDQLYPNEISSDYGFLPFGAGPRKCVGDQFAFLESVVLLVQVRFSCHFVSKPWTRPTRASIATTVFTASQNSQVLGLTFDPFRNKLASLWFVKDYLEFCNFVHCGCVVYLYSCTAAMLIL